MLVDVRLIIPRTFASGAGGANGFASALSRRSMAVIQSRASFFYTKIVICPKAEPKQVVWVGSVLVGVSQ